MVFRLPSNTIRPKPAPTLSLPQRVPFHRTLIPPTDLYHHPTWAAQRKMDAGRPKRSRARVSYVEPTELDDDIADDESLHDESLDDSTAAADVASDEPSTDTEDVPSTHPDSDSGSDQEFTTDKVSSQFTISNPDLTLSRESSKPSKRRSRPRRSRTRRSRRSRMFPSASWISHPKSAS